MDFEEAYAAVIEKLRQKYKDLDQAGSSEELVKHAQNFLNLDDNQLKSITVKGNEDQYQCNVVFKLKGTVNDYIKSISRNGDGRSIRLDTGRWTLVLLLSSSII